MPKPELSASDKPSELKTVDVQPVESKLPLVVDFRNVTKTFEEGTPKAFTAIKDVTFAVEDLPGIGEFIGKYNEVRLHQSLDEMNTPFEAYYQLPVSAAC